jgi:hypothetical protein
MSFSCALVMLPFLSPVAKGIGHADVKAGRPRRPGTHMLASATETPLKRR